MTGHNSVVDVLTHKANHLSYHEFKCLQLKRKMIKFKMHFEVFHTLSSLSIQDKNCYKLNPEVTEPSKVHLLFVPLPKQRYHSPGEGSKFSIVFSHCWSSL